jgi:predicted RNase H-like HicB family nuclease/predicted RNA binding protein YcfA (HicA-like mRNA interferase family)
MKPPSAAKSVSYSSIPSKGEGAFIGRLSEGASMLPEMASGGLSGDGWIVVRQRGFHAIVQGRGRQTMVPLHGNQMLPTRSMAMIRHDDAGDPIVMSSMECSHRRDCSHRAVFTYDEVDRVWLVQFPNLPGCHTYGETLDEAREHAREALQLWLENDDVSIEEEIRPTSAAAG